MCALSATLSRSTFFNESLVCLGGVAYKSGVLLGRNDATMSH